MIIRNNAEISLSKNQSKIYQFTNWYTYYLGNEFHLAHRQDSYNWFSIIDDPNLT